MSRYYCTRQPKFVHKDCMRKYEGAGRADSPQTQSAVLETEAGKAVVRSSAVSACRCYRGSIQTFLRVSLQGFTSRALKRSWIGKKGLKQITMAFKFY